MREGVVLPSPYVPGLRSRYAGARHPQERPLRADFYDVATRRGASRHQEAGWPDCKGNRPPEVALGVLSEGRLLGPHALFRAPSRLRFLRDGQLSGAGTLARPEVGAILTCLTSSGPAAKVGIHIKNRSSCAHLLHGRASRKILEGVSNATVLHCDLAKKVLARPAELRYAG
jgi:hypothetical protein